MYVTVCHRDKTEDNGVESCVCVIIFFIFSLSLDQQQVQQMLGHLAVPPARRWLPEQQAPQSDRGTHTIYQTCTSTLNATDRL